MLLSDVWDTLLGRGLRFVHGCRTRNLVKERGLIFAWTNGIAPHQFEVIEPNPTCCGKAHSNRPGTIRGYEYTEPGCALTILRIPSIIRIKEMRMASPARLFERFLAVGTNGRLNLSFSWQASEDPL